ncbi:acyltransferase [Rhizobium ruizarguesonis]|nr:acyltransferase [Rhizobium ruizarguesonis]
MTGTKSLQLAFRNDVNALRALAVTAVVCFHFGVVGFTGGFVGVDVFFVISGYLMTQIVVDRINRGYFSLFSFYLARARRIVPALLALVMVLLTLGFIWLAPLDYALLGKYAYSALGFYSNYVFAGEKGYFDNDAHTKWLLHTWSLSVEWQFYVGFPLLILAIQNFKSGAYSLPIVAFVAAISLLYATWEVTQVPQSAFYLLPSRSWELLSGAIVYYLPSRFSRIPLLLQTGIAAILSSSYFYTAAFTFPGFWATIPVLGACLILLANRDFAWMRVKPVAYLGTISYSLYLWHWPILVAARYTEIEFRPVTVAILISLAILLASLSYAFIEKPFSQARFDGERKALVIALIFVATIGFSCWVTRDAGVPGRIPNGVRELIAANDAGRVKWPFPSSCAAAMSSLETAPGSYCAEPPEKPNKVVIWGDSIAEQLFTTVGEIVKDRPKTGILWATRGGCMPVRGLARFEPQYLCPQLNDIFFKRALQEDVKAVLLTGLWMNYLEGVRYYYGFEQSPDLPIVCRAPGCDHFDSRSDAVAAAHDQLIIDVGQLTQLGKRVYLLLPIPSFRVPVATHIVKSKMLPWIRGMEMSAGDNAEYTRRVRAMFDDVAAKTGAILLDPSSELCKSGNCQYAENGISIYRDAFHLLPAGTEKLKPLLTQVIDAAN